MTIWLAAAAALLATLIPCALVCLRGPVLHRLVGLELAGMLVSYLMIVLAEAFRRPFFCDLALALSLMTLSGGLVFTRFLERWL